jgi:PAS domain S-box-containing protein
VSEAGLITQTNLTLSTLLGVARDALIGTPLTRFITREYQDDWYRLRRSCLTASDTQSSELCMNGAQQTPFWASLVVNTAIDSDGVAELRVALRDISAQRLLNDLVASEEAYRAMAQDMPLFVSAYLPDGTLTYVNTLLASLVGIPAQDLIGKNFADYLSAEDRRLVASRLSALSPEQADETHEQLFVDSDGKEHIHQWTNRAFFDSTGQMTRVQAVGQDSKYPPAEPGALNCEPLKAAKWGR